MVSIHAKNNRVVYLILQLLLFEALLGQIFIVRAQDNPNQPVPPPAESDAAKSPGFGEIFGGLTGNYFGDPIESDPTGRFNGWSELFQGYQGIPSLLDPKGDPQNPDIQRTYPEFAYHEQSSDSEPNRPSLKSYSLGADDEVIKSNLYLYQTIRDYQTGFAGSKQGRDDYLDRFASVMGVAQTTLAFLDKTVAAALNTVQSQADNNATNMLLKQISWSQAKLADPRREGLVVDTEEKLDYCLIHTGNVDNVNQYTRAKMNCSVEKCGEPPKDEAGAFYRTTEEGMKHGLFDYCVCCSEASATVNDTLLRHNTNDDRSPGTSLVDRVFWGEWPPLQGNDQDYVKDLRDLVKVVYGDLLLFGGGDEALSATPQDNQGILGADAKQVNTFLIGSDGATDPKRVIQSIRYPRLSVPQLVNMFRDGCYATPQCGPDVSREQCDALIANSPGKACPMTGMKITYGICPALKQLIVASSVKDEELGTVGVKPLPGGGTARDALNSMYVEASLGTPVTNLDIINFREFGDLGSTSSTLKRPCNPDEESADSTECWTPTGELRRVINSFCDSSAIGVVRRLHVRLKTLVLDHLALNQKATDREKQQMLALVDRVGSLLSLAEADVRASYMAQAALQGLSVAGSRKRELQNGAAREASNAGVSNGSTFSAGGGFGGVGTPTITDPGTAP